MENNHLNNNKQNLAEKKITEVLIDGLYLFVKNYGKIILPFIIFLTLSNFLIVVFVSQLEWYVNTLTPEIDTLLANLGANIESMTQSDLIINLGNLLYILLIVMLWGFLQGFIGAFFTTLSMIFVSSYLYKKYTNNDEMNDKVINKKMKFALLLIGCAVPFGFFMLFYIPGIIIFYFFIFTLFTYNLKGVESPVKEARLIAKGAFFKIIGVFLFSVLITLLVDSLYQNILNIIWPVDQAIINSWLDPYNGNYLILFLYNLTHDVVGILLAPIFISIMTVLFSSLKARKDLGLNISNHYPQNFGQRRYVQQEQGYVQNEPLDIKNEGFFCPYCGIRIGTIKKFCPNCGESLKGLNL